jgi:hypothetical protein
MVASERKKGGGEIYGRRKVREGLNKKGRGEETEGGDGYKNGEDVQDEMAKRGVDV